MQKKIILDTIGAYKSQAPTRVITPFKNDGLRDRIISSDDGNAFSKYALLRPKGNGGYMQVGGTMKERKK